MFPIEIERNASNTPAEGALSDDIISRAVYRLWIPVNATVKEKNLLLSSRRSTGFDVAFALLRYCALPGGLFIAHYAYRRRGFCD